jgi:hypothetical protein
MPASQQRQLADVAAAVAWLVCEDVGSNNVGTQGCAYLAQGHWASLQEIGLSSPVYTKAATTLTATAAGSSPKWK